MGILSNAKDAPDPRQEQPDVEQAHRRLEELRALEEQDEKKRLNADVPAELYNRFKAKCEDEGRSMSKVLREFLYAYVSD